MKHVSYGKIRSQRRVRKALVVTATVGSAVLLAVGYASASTYTTPTATTSTSRSTAATSNGTASTTPTSSNGASPSTSTHRGAARYRFRTIDDAKDPTFNQLLGINDRGRIVGYFGSGADAAHPNEGFRIVPPYRQRDFLDKNFPGSAQTQVVGVNNAAVAVGFYVDANGANIGFVAHGQHYTAVANPATSAAAPFNQLLGINNRGIAVGFYNDADGASHGYTYDTASATFTPVSLPKAVTANSVTATGIADDGDVSGFYTVGKVTIGFALVRGEFQTLSFGANTNTQALGINNHDRVVGSYVDAAGTTHGFVWSKGSLVTVDDPNAADATVVNGLNNRGQLVGFYTDGAGNTHGFLATRRTSDDDTES